MIHNLIIQCSHIFLFSTSAEWDVLIEVKLTMAMLGVKLNRIFAFLKAERLPDTEKYPPYTKVRQLPSSLDHDEDSRRH